MNNKQELSTIKEANNLLHDYHKCIENIENQIYLLIKENKPSINNLENIKGDKPNQNELIMDNISDLKQKLEEIKNKLESIKEEITDRLSIYEDKINNFIIENLNEDNYAIKENKDMSLSDSFDGISDFNYYFLCLNSPDFQENNKPFEEIFPKDNDIKSIEKKNISGNMNFNSSSDKNNTPNYLFKCSVHPDKPALYRCNNHCQKNFCSECYGNYFDNSEHGELINIYERIRRDSNSIISREKDNFLKWIKLFYKNNFKKCNDLLNKNKIPNLPQSLDANIIELEEQKLFLDKIFEKYEEIQVLDRQQKPNEQLLYIIKNITDSSGITFQSEETNINIYQHIDDNAKFYISIYPHRNIDNHEKFNKNISCALNEKFTELKKNYIMNDNYAFIIVNEYLNKKNYNKNIFITEEKNIQHSLYILNNIFSLKKNYLIESCQINANKLDKEYDAIYFKSEENDIIEGEKYFPPIGWFGIGLKNKKDLNGPIAYLTFNKKLNNKQLQIILNEIIEKKNLDKLEYQSTKKEFDKRHWNIVGKGIYLFPNIETADKYTGTFDINNKKYKIVLLVKVKKDKIKEPKHNKIGYWVVEKEYVKICRILFKEINSA